MSSGSRFFWGAKRPIPPSVIAEAGMVRTRSGCGPGVSERTHWNFSAIVRLALVSFVLLQSGDLFADAVHPEETGRSIVSENGRVSPARLSARSFRMTRAFDGDSFMAADDNLAIHVRIVGIDAPERKNRKRGTPSQPYGNKAAHHLKGLISNRSFRVKGYGMDAYNRHLAEVFAEGRNIGLAMVEAGYAEVYKGRLPKGFDARPYLAAERRARKHKRGMWIQGRGYVSPRQWRARHPR